MTLSAWLVVGSDMDLGKEDVSSISDIVFSAYAICLTCGTSFSMQMPTCTLRERTTSEKLSPSAAADRTE